MLITLDLPSPVTCPITFLDLVVSDSVRNSGTREIRKDLKNLHVANVHSILVEEKTRAFLNSLIGPGGKNIRDLQEETGANIEVDDEGKVYISSRNSDAVQAAKEHIEAMSAEPEVGKTYDAKVVKIMPGLGAFVQFMPGREGLVHISQLEHKRVERVEDVLKQGQEFKVKVTGIDSQGRVNLSRKALLPIPEGRSPSLRARPEVAGKTPQRCHSPAP